MGKYEEINKEIGSIVTLTQAGILSIAKGVSELNVILKGEGLEILTEDMFKAKFIPQPQTRTMTPEQMEELAKKARIQRTKHEKEIKLKTPQPPKPVEEKK